MATIHNFYVRNFTVHESQRTESRGETISAKVTPSLKDALSEIRDELGYKSLSELVNHACTEFVIEWAVAKKQPSGKDIKVDA